MGHRRKPASTASRLRRPLRSRVSRDLAVRWRRAIPCRPKMRRDRTLWPCPGALGLPHDTQQLPLCSHQHKLGLGDRPPFPGPQRARPCARTFKFRQCLAHLHGMQAIERHHRLVTLLEAHDSGSSQSASRARNASIWRLAFVLRRFIDPVGAEQHRSVRIQLEHESVRYLPLLEAVACVIYPRGDAVNAFLSFVAAS